MEGSELSFENISMNPRNASSGIDMSHFSLIKVIGTGSYGKVMLAKKKDNKIVYAIKILKKKDLITKG